MRWIMGIVVLLLAACSSGATPVAQLPGDVLADGQPQFINSYASW